MAAYHYRVCRTEEDFVQFTLFFIRHRKDFSANYSLADVLMHTLETIPTSHIFLTLDGNNKIVAWGVYRYTDADYEPHPEGEIVFVDSAVIAEQHRSSRLFLNGLLHMVRHIAEENDNVRTFQFFALQDHAYLTRLYSKFATIVGQREGSHGMENIFSSNLHNILNYVDKFEKHD